MPQSKDATAPVVFEFAQSHQIRVVMIDDAPWFVVADVCAVLNIQNASQAVEKLDADEKGLCSTYTPGGQQQLSVVSEPGLYTLILRCRDAVKPGTVAYKFRKWVTAEVLPALRKTGRYEMQPATAQKVAPISADPSLVNANHVTRLLREIAQTAKFMKHTPQAHSKVEKYLLNTFGLDCLHVLPVEHVERVSQWLHGLRLQIAEHDISLEMLEARFIGQIMVQKLECK